MFLREYNIVQLAIGFIMGAASNSVIKSLVDNIIMPIVVPLTKGSWRDATLYLGPVALKWGAFLGDALHFIILAFIVYVITKKILKQVKEEEKQEKKEAAKK